MNQAGLTTLRGGLVLALALAISTLAVAGGSGGRDTGERRHSHDFTDKRMFVANRMTNTVDVYDRTGNWVLDLAAAGLDFPFGVDVDDGNLYVVSQKSNEVYAYLHDGKGSGDRRAEHSPPQLQLLVPGGSGGLTTPFYTTVSDGTLYVSSYGTDEVLRYDAETASLSTSRSRVAKAA